MLKWKKDLKKVQRVPVFQKYIKNILLFEIFAFNFPTKSIVLESTYALFIFFFLNLSIWQIIPSAITNQNNRI